MLMEEVLRRENLMEGLKARPVQQGSAGSRRDDRRSPDALPEGELAAHPGRVAQRGRTFPQPVRRVEIPKPDGKGTRCWAYPTVLDRFIQQAILQVLYPLFDPHFSESSYGFRPGRGSHDAVKAAREHVEAGYRCVVDMDLEKFFDRVNHDVLMARVARRVRDKRAPSADPAVSDLRGDGGGSRPGPGGRDAAGRPAIAAALQHPAGRSGQGAGDEGATASVVMPMTATSMSRSKAAGERVMESITRFLEKRLRLKVNREKSAVGRPWERKFLGYSMTWHKSPKLKVAPDSVKTGQGAHPGDYAEGPRAILAKGDRGVDTRILRGWVAYFRLSKVKNAFRGTGSMDATEAALHIVAAVEEAAHQSQEADANGGLRG